MVLFFQKRFFIPLLFIFFLITCTLKDIQLIESNESNNNIWIPSSNGIIKERWIDNNTFQAYIKEPYTLKLAKHIYKVKLRLAWLLLLDHYQLSKNDISIAHKFANSNIFKNLGKQRVLYKINHNKIYILAVLKNNNLKKIWEDTCLEIEDKFYHLKKLKIN